MPKILVVDDDEMNRDMLSRRLERKGFEVSLAVNGKEAVESAQANPPDLILMDLSMPVLDGYEATKILKAGDGTVIACNSLELAVHPRHCRSPAVGTLWSPDSDIRAHLQALGYLVAADPRRTPCGSPPTGMPGSMPMSGKAVAWSCSRIASSS